ncbi:MAG: type II toxin-antitoxin system prevent-host-death family antitoxin [Patescibacteria group bacterium]|nr:type II toxin-antitoxin system prevent-host-death family antitoxin [Patescibacteria group bacterium]
MSIVISATEARNNFFDILNRVLYGNEVVLISKAGTDTLAKVESVPDSVKILNRLAGSISAGDAKIMKKAVKDMRKMPYRKIKSFD